MELMRCRKCGQPLVYEETQTMTYRVSANGACLINSSVFTPTPRIEREIVCPACGTAYFWTLESEQERLKLLYPAEEIQP